MKEDNVFDVMAEVKKAIELTPYQHWASDHSDPTVLEYTGGQWLQQGKYNSQFIKPYLFSQTGYVTYEGEV